MSEKTKDGLRVDYVRFAALAACSKADREEESRGGPR